MAISAHFSLFVFSKEVNTVMPGCLYVLTGTCSLFYPKINAVFMYSCLPACLRPVLGEGAWEVTCWVCSCWCLVPQSTSACANDEQPPSYSGEEHVEQISKELSGDKSSQHSVEPATAEGGLPSSTLFTNLVAIFRIAQ